MKVNSEIPVRLEVIDAMRGFALFGLFSVHMQEHYNLSDFPAAYSSLIGWLDHWTRQTIFFVFAGKSYTIFAFLFGLSFYIQVDRQEQKGNHFLWRFLWRLILLFILGIFHGLLYPGDILAFFALTGLLLLLFHYLSNTVLILLAAALLLQLPAYLEIYQMILNNSSINRLSTEMFQLFKESIPIYSHGTLKELLTFNFIDGRKANWLFMLLYGRVSQTIGLFILGILIGRTKVLENIPSYSTLLKKILLWSIIIFIPMLFLRSYVEITFFDGVKDTILIIVDSYINLVFSIVLFSGFVLLFQLPFVAPKIGLLKYPGRMSLTNYILQSLLCIPLFYGFGFGLYRALGFFFSFCLGLLIYIGQIIFSKWWMSKYNYGPLEYIWRVLTFFSFKAVRFKK